MAKKIHWSGQGGGSLRCAASRSQGLHTVMHRPCEAQKFVQLSKDSPDLYCLPCTTQARLALAKESAPKPDSRTDSDRYAELRKLVEAYQNAKNYPEAESLLVEIRNWSHR